MVPATLNTPWSVLNGDGCVQGRVRIGGQRTACDFRSVRTAAAELAIGVREAATEPGRGYVSGADGQRQRGRQQHIIPLSGSQGPGRDGATGYQGSTNWDTKSTQRAEVGEGLRLSRISRVADRIKSLACTVDDVPS